jgi:hypothetical protein
LSRHLASALALAAAAGPMFGACTPTTSIAATAADSPQVKPMESAKRRAPVVKPVVVQGIRYEPLRRPDEHGFTQSGGVLAAFNDKSGKYLWGVQLYTTPFDAAEERDVQEVYIKELAHDKARNAILATDERKRIWVVDIATHAVAAAS